MWLEQQTKTCLLPILLCSHCPKFCLTFYPFLTSATLPVYSLSFSLYLSLCLSLTIPSLTIHLRISFCLHLTISLAIPRALPPSHYLWSHYLTASLLSSSLCLTLYPQLVYPSLALSHRCACSHILLIFLFFICSSQSWWYCSNISHELTSLSPSEQKIFAHIQRHPQLPLTWHRIHPKSWEIQRSSKSHDQPR